MAETVTFELPEPLAKRAHAVAARTSRPVEEVFVEWLDRAAADLPVELLPDEQVVELREVQLSESQHEDLSRLLTA